MSDGICPERALLRRLRRSAWMSGDELDDRADLYHGASLDFETSTRPLSDEDRREMVAMLEVLMVCRRDYLASVRLWMAATGTSSRMAARLFGTSKHNVNRWLRGELQRWPRAALRDEVDRVLTEWERDLCIAA